MSDLWLKAGEQVSALQAKTDELRQRYSTAPVNEQIQQVDVPSCARLSGLMVVD